MYINIRVNAFNPICLNFIGKIYIFFQFCTNLNKTEITSFVLATLAFLAVIAVIVRFTAFKDDDQEHHSDQQSEKIRGYCTIYNSNEISILLLHFKFLTRLNVQFLSENNAE